MIINNLNIRRTRLTFNPCEANPPLLIDADATLPIPVTMQCLKAVASQTHQVVNCFRRIQNVQSLFCLFPKAAKLLVTDPIREQPLCFLASKALNHSPFFLRLPTPFNAE